MNNPPIEIDGAKVKFFTVIDERHEHTGSTSHLVDGKLMGTFPKLAICQYEGEERYYLFYCNEKWETITDTLHDNLEEAKKHAEFEYEGVSKTWRTL